MAAPQQFSLRWNNYSQHIVTALEDLRADDELTDVTLSCEGQRVKGHKILLSACSSYFRETFKENPCKHPIIILKGVTFVDLEAVITFMYNGQVNVSQERLPFFLQTAELLQIKGLTDMNDKEDVPKKRPLGNSMGLNQNSNSSLSHSASRSGTPDNVQQRPPSPKRKRAAVENFSNDGASVGSGSFPSSSNTSLPVMGGSGSNGAVAGSSGLNNQSTPNLSGVTSMGSSQEEPDDLFHPDVSIKYEDDGLQDDDDYDDKQNMSSEDNDNSVQDMMCNVEPGSIGSFLGSGSGGLGTSGTDSSHASRAGRAVVVVGHSTTGDPVSYGLTKNGSAKLCVGPYAYTLHHAHKDAERKYWRCQKRKQCKGRLNQIRDHYTVTTPHTCLVLPQQADLYDHDPYDHEPGILTEDYDLDFELLDYE